VIKPLILFVLTCLSLLAYPAYTQKIITAQSGQKIVINPDGTWSEYQDTVKTVNESIINTPVEKKVEAQMAFVNREQDDYQSMRTDILATYKDIKQKQSNNKRNISDIKGDIKKAKKNQLDDLSLKRLEERKLQYYLSEYDLEKEMDAFKQFKISVDRIDKQGFDSKLYQTLRQNYTEFGGSSYVTIEEEEEEEEELSDQVNNDSAVDKQYKNSDISLPAPQFSEAEIRDRDIKRELTYYSFDTDDNDVLRNPPDVECNIKQKGIDKRTRKERTEMESGFLFGYTHPNIKNYFKEKDYLTCNAKLSKVGGLYYLSFEVRIASIKANKTYGSLDKGSGIRIKLINGETVNLYNITASTGHIEPLTGVTVYQTNYPMEKSEFKQLSKTELDKIGVIWSTGYEEYEIYEVDFLINQAECLKSS